MMKVEWHDTARKPHTSQPTATRNHSLYVQAILGSQHWARLRRTAAHIHHWLSHIHHWLSVAQVCAPCGVSFHEWLHILTMVRLGDMSFLASVHRLLEGQ